MAAAARGCRPALPAPRGPDMPMFKQQLRLCTSRDGVRLAYAITGCGAPLVKAANWMSHLEFDVGSRCGAT